MRRRAAAVHEFLRPNDVQRRRLLGRLLGGTSLSEGDIIKLTELSARARHVGMASRSPTCASDLCLGSFSLHQAERRHRRGARHRGTRKRRTHEAIRLNPRMTGRAPSGPRLLGDDVQHLVVWYHVLRALNPDENIIQLEVEAKGAGNVDDLVVRRSAGPSEYWQVKASIDASSPAGSDWLLGHPDGKASLLKRLYESWLKLPAGATVPEVVLATTKNIDPADPVLTMKDRNGRVADALRVGMRDLATARVEWAGHLRVSEDELIAFLEHVEFRTGIDEHGWSERVRDVAGSAHVRTDDAAIALVFRRCANG